MKILGIETSCDETAAAVVENGVNVLSNVISSQVALHRKTGGVVPEVAAREHVVKIIPTIDEALKKAKIKLIDVDAIAVTQGPGLLSSLIIGTTTAQTLSLATGRSLIPINHIAGHIYANWLEKERNIQFPCIVLTASGGHNELVLMKEHYDFELLGETLDDAAGEAFDKVARLLGLCYPGGPEIAKLAKKGNAGAISFPKAYLDAQSYDFSFSGLKTAVLNKVFSYRKRINLDTVPPSSLYSDKKLPKNFVADCAVAFEEAVVEVLSDKLLRAAEQYCAKSVLLAGGVSANLRLRTVVSEKIRNGYYFNIKDKNSKSKLYKITLSLKPALFYPINKNFCTDNAAMIAGAAYYFYKKSDKIAIKRTFSPDPHLPLQ